MMKTILVIDDDDDIREVAQLSLELGGFDVLAAGTGVSGIERAIAARPNAILLDVMMPDMDGPTTLQSLRADDRTRDIPVVFLTAKIGADDRGRLLALGVTGVLAKPFDPMQLAADLCALLGWAA